MSDYYVLISLPFSQTVEQQTSAQFANLQRQLGDLGPLLLSFQVPMLKVGTLDSLLEASDDLAKLDPQLESTINKLASILEEASGKPKNEIALVRLNQSQPEMTCDKYIKHFSWNMTQFDIKEPIRVHVERLGQIAATAEERVRGEVTEFSDARNKLTAAKRKVQGNLAACSINSIVSEWLNRHQGKIYETEFLTTVFVAVPVGQKKEFLKEYWQINEFVVPDSAAIVADDPEYILFAVVVFKKAAEDFKLGCRKRRFVIREMDVEAESEESVALMQAQVEQRRARLLSLLKLQFSICFIAWIHVKAIRVFVESLLRYGLPPRFIPILLAVDPHKEMAIRQRLSQTFSDLGNPFADDAVSDNNSLQYEYPYVSIKITNVVK